MEEKKIKRLHRYDVINKLASVNSAKSYLEVGVAKGITFSNVEIRRKVAVDPKLGFDYKSLKNHTFHEIASDEYFLDHAKENFDFIYLDGLHTFEQTLRDFNNSISFLNKGGIILIDDTCPNNVYSALPSQVRAGKYRRLAGIMNPSWMGDTYKLIYFIHDFFPQYSYKTITDNHGQTVVWKRQRKSIPIYNSLSKISSMDYFDYLDTKDLVMNFSTIDEILGEFK